MNNTQTLSPNKIAQVVADLQHITKKLNDIMEIMSEPSVPTIEEQIGLNFYEWAELFFSNKRPSRNIDHDITLNEAMLDFQEYYGIGPVDEEIFYAKLRLFADHKRITISKGTILKVRQNPEDTHS